MTSSIEAKWYNTPIQGIPKSEKICVRHFGENGELNYIITVDRDRKYKLYKCDNETVTYTKHKSNDPTLLDKFMEVDNEEND